MTRSTDIIEDGSRAEQAAGRPPTRWTRLRSWLGLERNILVMLAATLIVGMGEELWLRFVPKYLELLGATAWVIAIYGAQKDLLDAIYQYPGGWIADRLGRRAALVLFTLLGMLGYALYLVGQSWHWVLAGTVFVMAWHSLTLPAVFAIIADHLPRNRRAIGFGVQSILKRVPIVLAPALGGWLIAALGLAVGMKVGLALTLVLAAVAVGIVLRYYTEEKRPAPDQISFGAIWRGMDPHLKRLLFADCLARWAEGVPKVFVILYVVNVLGRSEFEFGWLTSVQMLTATVIYVPLAKLADRMNGKGFVLATFAFFAVFPLALAAASNLLWVALAFVIAGLREVGEPARKALIVDLAHDAARGRAVGMYYLVRGLVVFPASLVGGWLWYLDPRFPFYFAFLMGTAGLLFYAVWGPGGRFSATTASRGSTAGDHSD